MDFDRGIARVPPLIVALGVVGTVAAWWLGGASYAGPFLVGAAAAWLNFRLLEAFVNRLGRLAVAASAKPPRMAGIKLFIQFASCVLGAFVILRISGFNIAAAFCGFLVCPAAVMLELVYELLTYGHS